MGRTGCTDPQCLYKGCTLPFEMYMSLADSMRSLFLREEKCDFIASATDMFIVYHVTLKEATR